jgi:hypothetical protein
VSDAELERWLKANGADHSLLTDDEIIAELEAIVEAGYDTGEDFTDLFEERAREVLHEKESVEYALWRELHKAKGLFPVEWDTKEKPFERVKERDRIRKKVRARYDRFLAALDNYSYSAYLSGETEDFISTSKRDMDRKKRAKETLEREREKALREEAVGV